VPSERARVIALLDELQAAERAGAEALREWIATCRDPALRGGLRVIAARDAGHADLVEARLRALGGTAGAVPGRNLTALCTVLAAADVSDRSKLTILLARFPARGYDPFTPLVLRIEDDDETRALLEAIGDDERATIEWLRLASGAPAHVAGDDDGPEGRARLRAFLDALRAARAAGADVFQAWVTACGLDGLRGGLRTIAAREAVHARLLAERLRDLGEESRSAVAPSVLADALAVYGAREIPDARKLERLLARYPDDGDVAQPIFDVADRLRADLETREMLRLIAAGDAASIAWLRAYRQAAGDEGLGVRVR
jgi:hypothetical protein